jgi:hypothetical protein
MEAIFIFFCLAAAGWWDAKLEIITEKEAGKDILPHFELKRN